MFHKKTLEPVLKKAAKQFPVVTLTGPRQSGKTTLVRKTFPHDAYVSLELPDQRAFAREDPRAFLAQFQKPVILDEAQRAPDLFSYIQVLVDEHPDWTGRFILTGSQNLLLLQNISQTLAGRCAILHLLPFSLSELQKRKALSPEKLGSSFPKTLQKPKKTLFEILWRGFYPRIHDKKLSPPEWYAYYEQTYIERDVPQVTQIGDLETFHRFLRICAGRSGQLLHLSGIASDCGISHTTARRWLSILEASFLIILLPPYYKNFGKRLIKSPKLYFTDSGLLCYLLHIDSPKELFHRSERGAIFESFVISEIYKHFLHTGKRPSLFFWRDKSGHEIDLLIDLGHKQIPIEIKSAQTISPDFFKNLFYWKKLTNDSETSPVLFYGGNQAFQRSGICVYPWFWA